MVEKSEFLESEWSKLFIAMEDFRHRFGAEEAHARIAGWVLFGNMRGLQSPSAVLKSLSAAASNYEENKNKQQDGAFTPLQVYYPPEV